MAEERGGAVKRMRSDYFGEEIITEILARLPVRSLLRFRCVCKSWRAIIAASHFVKKHLSCKKNKSRLLFLQEHPQSIDYEVVNKVWEANRELQFPVEFPSSKERRTIIRVLGSCNGLVCFEYERIGVFLCNPSTRDSNLLPDPPTESHKTDFYGFGYDFRTDDYKAVRGSTSSESVDVFTLKSDSWRSIRGLHCAGAQGMGCLFNGALHWLVEAGSKIVSFSVAEEKFVEMVPLLLDRDHAFGGLLVYKDHLCMYEIMDGAPGFVSVWSMGEYGVMESWTEVIHFSLEESRTEKLRPLCILQNGQILMHRILSDYSEFDYLIDHVPTPLQTPLYGDQVADPAPDEFVYPVDHDPAPDEFVYPVDHDPAPVEFGYPADLDPAPNEFDYHSDADVFHYPDPGQFDDPDVYDDQYDDIDPYFKSLMHRILSDYPAPAFKLNDDHGSDCDEFDYPHPNLLPCDDPDVSDVSDDPYDDIDPYDIGPCYQQTMPDDERRPKSSLVLVGRPTSNWVLDVDLPGFGAVIYRETFVSPY